MTKYAIPLHILWLIWLGWIAADVANYSMGWMKHPDQAIAGSITVGFFVLFAALWAERRRSR